MAASMRGLTMFIADIRSSTSKEQEKRRVIKELAHIRQKFTSKSLDGYNKKKYIWKLLYMYMLGYDIEFGHLIALDLITSPKYTEKNAGYTACAILLNENHELLRLIIQSAKKDLASSNDVNQCLALSCIANVGGQEFAESLAPDVQKILCHGQTKAPVKKKAALCLLRLYRKYPDLIPQESWPSKVIALLDDSHYGVLTSVMSLLLGLCSHSASGYEEAPAKCIHLLSQISFVKDRKSTYKYYSTISPWLQVKFLKLLQYFSPPKDANVARRLRDVLNDILTKTKITNIINKNNADHSILFEAINVIIHLCIHGVTELQTAAISHLGRFISIREPNFRYLGLNTMAKLAKIPGSLKSIKRHQNTIQFSLKDADVSIRKRALDLLYVMCDRSNSEEIVSVMLKHLQSEALEIREELVLKIAILAEKFAPNLQVGEKVTPNLRWYVDNILQLISVAGDFVTDDIWYRVVQIVTNNEELQDYAATTCLNFLKNPAVHENGVKVGAYVLGEFAHQISDTKLTGENGDLLFGVLMDRFKTATTPTKALLMSAFVKLGNSYPELKAKIDKIFETHRAYVDSEIQQRACEYYNMDKMATEKEDYSKLMTYALGPMPNFPERKSNLLRPKKGTTDRDVWSGEGEEKEGETPTTEGKEEESDEEESGEESGDEKEGKEEADEEEEEEEKKEKGKEKPTGPPVQSTLLFATEEAPQPVEKGEEGETGGHSSDEEGGGSSDEEGGSKGRGKGESKEDRAPAYDNPAKQSGLDFDPFADTPKGSTSGGSSSSLPEQKAEWVATLFSKPSGTLYDSEELLIEIKTPPPENPAEYRMALYLQNKADFPMTNAIVHLPPEDAFKIQCRLTIKDQIYRDPTTAFTIEPGPSKKFVYLCLWHCKKPFSDPPKIRLSFTLDDKEYEVGLTIPLLLSTFIKAPASELDAPKFVGFWKKFENEVGPSVYRNPTPVDKDKFAEVLTKIMKMSLVSGVDKEAGNLYAAGQFHTIVKSESGQQLTVPCFLRIETKPNIPLYRITAHSNHKLVSGALISAFAQITGSIEKK